jgi:hypothetical protein
MAWKDPGVARAWRLAWNRSPAFRAYMRAYTKEFRAERRARGLCIDCAEISVRFVRCLKCRARANANRKRVKTTPESMVA